MSFNIKNMHLIYSFLTLAGIFFSCSNAPEQPKLKLKPLTVENLQGYWAQAPGKTAFLQFESDSIRFLEDGQSFQYMITGDSIQFEIAFATFYFGVKIMEGDSMRMISPHTNDLYFKVIPE